MNNNNYWDKIKTIFKGFLIGLDSLEFIFVTIFGTVLFLTVPFYLIRDLFNKGHVFLAVFLIFIAVASLRICIRDFKNKKWSGISILIVVLWVMCFAISGWMLMS